MPASAQPHDGAAFRSSAARVGRLGGNGHRRRAAEAPSAAAHEFRFANRRHQNVGAAADHAPVAAPADGVILQALVALGMVPICADEGIAGVAEVLAHHQARAMRGINLKLMKAGGPRAAMRVASLCEALGLSITVAGKVAESSISASNTLAVACAAHNVDWGLNLTHIYLAEDLVRNPIRLEQGMFVAPKGPGNGVEVDESIVERYRVR